MVRLKLQQNQYVRLFARESCRIKMAERTGLEPATTGVTGRYSNQLNYRSTYLIYIDLEADKMISTL